MIFVARWWSAATASENTTHAFTLFMAFKPFLDQYAKLNSWPIYYLIFLKVERKKNAQQLSFLQRQRAEPKRRGPHARQTYSQ